MASGPPPEQPIASPQRMKEIFSQAVELPAPQRSAFVQQACGDDQEPPRRRQVLARKVRRCRLETSAW